MSELLRGYAVLSLCGWAAFPLVHRLLKALPDRGYALCRCFGWVLTAWLAWILAWATGRPLTTHLALGSIAFVGLSCWLPTIVGRSEDDGPLSLPRRKPGLVACIEALFLAGCLLFGALQARNPAVDPDSERFMDYAFLRASLRSPGLPIMDPWFAGREAAYYHFGYALVAFLVRAGGADPARFFTAAVALPYALLWIGCFGVGVALTGRLRGGAWAAFLVLGAGNLKWIGQGVGALRPGSFDWFAPSRAIEGTITEFPWFSLLWGDLHPYAIALPIVACGLAFVLAEGSEARSRGAIEPGGTRSARIAAGRAPGFALVAGAALAAHPWDFPFLLGAALAVTLAAGGPRKLARLSAVGIAGALSCVLYLPFLKGLVPGARGVGWVALRSAPGEWLAAYGPFVLLAALASPVLAFRGRPGLHEEGEARHGERLALVLAAFALLTALLGEVLYVRDLFEPTPLVRMNTIFKLHRFAWLLLGLASSPLVERLLAPGSPAAARLAGLRRGAGPAVVLVVLAGASVYPILGTAAWLRARESEARRQTDGAARAALLPGADAEALFRATSPGDAAAAFFIARTAGAHDILLEEAGEPYTWSSRISTFTGVPAVLGWGNHEAVWRQGWAEVQRRGADVAAIYEHPGSSEACDQLRAYGVKWMVVGDRERQRYGAAVAGVGRLANPVFAGDGTEVYLAGEVCAAAGRSAGGEFPAVRHERAGAAPRAAERP